MFYSGVLLLVFLSERMSAVLLDLNILTDKRYHDLERELFLMV